MRKISIIVSALICTLLFVSTTVSAEQKPAKLAVAADGKTADSSVSSLAGRSPYCLIFDETGKLLDVKE